MSGREQLRNAIRNDHILRKSISDQVTLEAHAGEGELKTLQVNKISLNIYNPRKLNISISDIHSLISEAKKQIKNSTEAINFNNREYTNLLLDLIHKIEDEDLKVKYEKLFFLAKSINVQGLIQLISVIISSDGKYIILAGERRFLAYIFLEKETIRAIVKQQSNDVLKDKTTSLIENIIRDDLSTAEKIDFIDELIDDYETKHNLPISPETLSELISESERSCRRYIRFIRSSDDIRTRIRSGELKSIREIENALKIDINDDLDEIPIINIPIHANIKKEKLGRKKASISLGRIDNTKVLKVIIDALANNKIISENTMLDWNDLGQVQSYWDNIIKNIKTSD